MLFVALFCWCQLGLQGSLEPEQGQAGSVSYLAVQSVRNLAGFWPVDSCPPHLQITTLQPKTLSRKLLNPQFLALLILACVNCRVTSLRPEIMLKLFPVLRLRTLEDRITISSPVATALGAALEQLIDLILFHVFPSQGSSHGLLFQLLGCADLFPFSGSLPCVPSPQAASFYLILLFFLLSFLPQLHPIPQFPNSSATW